MHSPQAIADVAVSPSASRSSDRRYELIAIPLLALGFGIVGLDRFIILPLFPVMAQDLGLSYQALGLISAALSLTWGLAAALSGGLADRHGPRRVIVPAMIMFSLLVATTGLASGLFSLLCIRGVMGVAEGAYMPAATAATHDASHPSRVGLNMGLTQMTMGLFGHALAPVLATQLLKVVPSWHWVFGLVAVPGLVLAFVLHRVLRRGRVATADRAHATPTAPPTAAGAWREVLRYRNVVVGALCAMCWLSAMVVMNAFLPSYLTDHLHVGLESMGLILGASGLGAMLGIVFIPALSDKLGRKPLIVGAVLIELVALWVLIGQDTSTALSTALIVLVMTMNGGVIVTTVGPMATQAVPAHLAGTAAGLVMGAGEVVGGALVPALAGGLATAHGITIILPLAMGALVMGAVLAVFGLREPLRADGHPGERP